MGMIKAILDSTPFTNIEQGKIMYKLRRENIEKMIVTRNALLNEYEEEMEVENEWEDGKKTKMKVKQIPQEKTQEVNQKIGEIESEMELDSTIYLPMKLCIDRFPSLAVDKQTGEKGLKGEWDIEAYLHLKEKFI